MTTPAERNTAAEVRSIEAGHRATLEDGKLRVVSDTNPDLVYYVGAVGPAEGPIRFTCSPHHRKGGDPTKDNHGYTRSREAGVLPCLHAATAVRRLEREGLARYDNLTGLWVTTDRAAEAAAEKHAVDDPFECFSR